MDIVVCVKQVPISASEGMDPSDHTVVREGVPLILNPADEQALEAGLGLVEACGGSVTVLSMGRLSARDMLSDIGKLGVDRLLLVNDPLFSGSDTFATSRILASVVKKHIPFDLIICGRRALDGETGQTGPELATLLCIPCITNVDSYTKLEEKDVIRCRRVHEEHMEIVDVHLPALLTIHETARLLRRPSLTSLRKAKSLSVDLVNNTSLQLDPAVIGLKGSPTRVVSVSSFQKKTRTCQFFEPKCEAVGKICGEIVRCAREEDADVQVDVADL